VNVPRGVPNGWASTIQAARTHTTNVMRRTDPWGRHYYWLDEGRLEWAARRETDYDAVKAGLISVTPLQADLTAHEALERTAAMVASLRDAQAR